MDVAAPLRNVSAKNLSAKDYASDQEVRWCPGCGDYAILKAVEKTLADILRQFPPFAPAAAR